MKSTQKISPLWKALGDVLAQMGGRQMVGNVNVVRYTAGSASELQSGSHILFRFVRKGSCVVKVGKEWTTFHEGDVMVLVPDSTFQMEVGTHGVVCFQLAFLPENWSRLSLDAGQDILVSARNQLIKISEHSAIAGVMQRLMNEHADGKPGSEYMLLMGYAELQLYVNRYLTDNWMAFSSHEAFKKAVAYFRQNYSSEISMSAVASHCGISERYLRKLFSQFTQLSPIDYLNNIRIDRAVDLLRHTDCSVKEVCYRCGFQSPEYFTRVFKMKKGTTPSHLARSGSC